MVLRFRIELEFGNVGFLSRGIRVENRESCSITNCLFANCDNLIVLDFDRSRGECGVLVLNQAEDCICRFINSVIPSNTSLNSQFYSVLRLNLLQQGLIDREIQKCAVTNSKLLRLQLFRCLQSFFVLQFKVRDLL